VIEVPEELFAKRDKTRWGHIKWKWVNRWHKTEPLDSASIENGRVRLYSEAVRVDAGMLLRFFTQIVLTIMLPSYASSSL